MEITVEYLHLNLIVGTLLPVLVGIVTKSSASRRVKTFTNAFLSGVGGALVPILASCAEACTFQLQPVIVAAVTTWVTSIATYYGFWEPSGVDDVVHIKTEKFGLGA